MNLKGKTILLTGASGGIGQAIARQAAAAGARLILLARRAAPLKALAEELEQIAPLGHLYLATDATTAAGMAELVALLSGLQAQGEGPDVLINNAGVSQFALLEQQDFAATLTTNLLLPMQLIQQLLPQLRQKEQAMIVNVGSAFGSIGHPGYSGYCASKFGLRGFTEALRRELWDSKVQVLYFAPRATDTALNSAAVVAMNDALGNRSDSPQQVAAALLAQMQQGRARRFLGWPEQLFVRLNALVPALVDQALGGKAALIRRFASQANPPGNTPTSQAASASRHS
jgi:short-subunit dehydrogenase